MNLPNPSIVKIAKTEMVAILVEKNPNSLAAMFTIPDGTEAVVSTRVKMGQTSNIHAVVKADGKYITRLDEAGCDHQRHDGGAAACL